MAGGGARGVLAAGGERQAAAACISLGRTIARNAPASRCTPARVPSDATPPPCGAHTQLEPKDQIITAEPDVLSQRLTPADTFLVLACDGIWDVMDKCVRALPPARVPPCLRWLEARCAARRRACSRWPHANRRAPPPPALLGPRSQQVVDFVRERLGQGVAPHDITSELLNACLAHDPREARGIGCDNMTAAVRCAGLRPH